MPCRLLIFISMPGKSLVLTSILSISPILTFICRNFLSFSLFLAYSLSQSLFLIYSLPLIFPCLLSLPVCPSPFHAFYHSCSAPHLSMPSVSPVLHLIFPYPLSLVLHLIFPYPLSLPVCTSPSRIFWSFSDFPCFVACSLFGGVFPVVSSEFSLQYVYDIYLYFKFQSYKWLLSSLLHA